VGGDGGRVGHQADPQPAQGPALLGLETLQAHLHGGGGEERGQEGDHGAGASAPTTASARLERTCRIALFSRLGCTRFVSRITNSRRSGSIHIEVPVKPVWPKDRGERRRPPEE